MGRLYAILRAAFMSDEPVRGAPSIDAFSFRSQRVTRGTSTLRHIVLLLLFSLSPFHYPSIRASVHSVLLHACNQIISISLQRVRTYVRTFIFFCSRQKDVLPRSSICPREGQREIRFSPFSGISRTRERVSLFSVNYRE